MADERELYLQMIRASEKAIRQIEAQNFGMAREILISAQQECEEQILQEADLEAEEEVFDEQMKE